jgi:hypothetical protein
VSQLVGISDGSGSMIAMDASQERSFATHVTDEFSDVFDVVVDRVAGLDPVRLSVTS